VWLDNWKLCRAVLSVDQLGALRDARAQAATCAAVLTAFGVKGKVSGVATDGAADESTLQ
jgi:hypothetical protein